MLTQAQGVTHLFLLGTQVGQGMRRRRGFARKPLHDLDTRVGQREKLARIIREQANPADTKVVQDCGRQAEISAVRPEAQRVIGVDRVEAGVLKRVRLQLRLEPDTPALLVLVDQKPAPFPGDCPHGDIQLVVAITAQRPEHLARETLRMNV